MFEGFMNLVYNCGINVIIFELYFVKWCFFSIGYLRIGFIYEFVVVVRKFYNLSEML